MDILGWLVNVEEFHMGAGGVSSSSNKAQDLFQQQVKSVQGMAQKPSNASFALGGGHKEGGGGGGCSNTHIGLA